MIELAAYPPRRAAGGGVLPARFGRRQRAESRQRGRFRTTGGRPRGLRPALGLAVDRAAGGRPAGEAELLPLAHVADVHHLDVAAGHLGLDLLDGQIFDPRLRFLDHLPDGSLRLPHSGPPHSTIVALPARSGNALDAAKRPMSWRARSVRA